MACGHVLMGMWVWVCDTQEYGLGNDTASTIAADSEMDRLRRENDELKLLLVRRGVTACVDDVSNASTPPQTHRTKLATSGAGFASPPSRDSVSYVPRVEGMDVSLTCGVVVVDCCSRTV